MYDNVLHVPLIIRYPARLPAGKRSGGYNQHKDLAPTLLELAGIEAVDIDFDGQSLLPLIDGEVISHESEFYITECTWMRKHGWRTPQWKLIRPLEPDFHAKPPVELYNLVADPDENINLAETHPDVVAHLTERMAAWIAQREADTGLSNPMLTQGDAWHGLAGMGAFETSQQAYDMLRVRSVAQAIELQADSAETEADENFLHDT
jgi:arylsulfatase A-like enzyme